MRSVIFREDRFARPRLLWGVAVLCAALGARPSFAGDAKPAAEAQVAQLEAAVTKHEGDKSDTALAADAESARTLAADVADPALKGRLVAVVGKILDATREVETERAAIEALGALADPAGFRFLHPFLVLITPEAIAATSKMRSDESVPVLMDIVRSSRDLTVAQVAVKAFSTFGRNQATRVSILKDLVETMRKDWPGPGNPRANPIRYEALSATITTTLNAITGQSVTSPQDWFDLVDKYKTDLSALFGTASDAPAATPVDKASKDLTVEVERLVANVRQHLEAKADDALVADLGTLAPLAARVSEPSVRGRLTDLAGRALEGTRNPVVQRSALQALGALEDPSGFRFVRPLLLRTSVKGGRPLTFEAVYAAAKVQSDESVPVLLSLVADAEPQLASVALEAFSGFGTHKAVREKIVASLVDTVKKARNPPRPAGPSSPSDLGPGESYRYQLLSSSLTETLNAMTGRRLGSPEQWDEMIARHKDALSGLFLR